MALPYINLFIGDVKRDTDLLSPAAFGAYMRLLIFHLHRSKPIRGEATFTTSELTKIFGTETPEQTDSLLREIINPQFEVLDYIPTGDGKHFLRNRRMVREGEISKKRSEAGSEGGKKTQAKRKQTSEQNLSKEESKSETVLNTCFNDENGLETECEQKESKQPSKNEANRDNGLVFEANGKQIGRAKTKQNTGIGIGIGIGINEDNGGLGEEEIKKSSPIIHEGNSVLLVPELASVFKRYRQSYQLDPSKDYAALRMIGQAIAKAENISIYEIAGVDRVKEIFAAIIEFTLTHNLYRNFQLSQIEKYFQAICENYRNQAPAKNASTIQSNLQIAKGAADLVKRKYGGQE